VAFSSQVGFLIVQGVILALAIYLDRQERPVFRPWVAHFNLVVAVLLVPAVSARFFLAELTPATALPQRTKRAGDRSRTGDVQLGKLSEKAPEDYDPWG